jgi:hypothetical protein
MMQKAEKTKRERLAGGRRTVIETSFEENARDRRSSGGDVGI